MLKYEHVAHEITAAIANGKYKVGDKLPSLAELKIAYQVSKSTIVKALELLEKMVLSIKLGAVVYMLEIKNLDILIC